MLSIFSYDFWPSVFFFGGMSIKVFGSFFDWVVCVFDFELYKLLYIQVFLAFI